MSEIFIALIGDVVQSRAVDSRAELQEKLEYALKTINSQFREEIEAYFLITIGDEFQGLLRKPERVLDILAKTRAMLHPVELRFGIGVGSLDTPLQEEAIGMDGPAFHRAREAIERARQRETPLEVSVPGPGHAFAIYSLLYGPVRKSWTSRQRQVFDLAEAGSDGVEIAERLGISPAAVSQHLGASWHKQISIAREEWQEAFKAAFRAEEMADG